MEFQIEDLPNTVRNHGDTEPDFLSFIETHPTLDVKGIKTWRHYFQRTENFKLLKEDNDIAFGTSFHLRFLKKVTIVIFMTKLKII